MQRLARVDRNGVTRTVPLAVALVAALGCAGDNSPGPIAAGTGGSGGAGAPGTAGATASGGSAGGGHAGNSMTGTGGGAGAGGAGVVTGDAGAGDAAAGDAARPSDDAPREGDDAKASAGALGPVGFVCPAGATYGSPLPPSPRATTVRAGFMEAEGPVWLAAHGFLLVSDINENQLGEGRMFKYTPATDLWEPFAMKVGTNGLALDVDGTIVAASHDVQALTRFDPLTGARSDITGGGTYQGRKFTEVNDVVIRTDGNMYFTDPSFQPGAKGRAGQDTTAYYRFSPQGVVTRIAAATNPNGIALSPDGGFLYVVGGIPLRRHKVDADGSVDPAFTVLAQTGSDGMAVDCAGNLYLTAGNGVLVLTPEGKTIGNIAVPASGYMTNAAFGDEDRKTLYITTRNAVHKIKLLVPGFPN